MKNLILLGLISVLFLFTNTSMAFDWCKNKKSRKHLTYGYTWYQLNNNYPLPGTMHPLQPLTRIRMPTNETEWKLLGNTVPVYQNAQYWGMNSSRTR